MNTNKKKISESNWLQKARESWANTGIRRPAIAVVPKEGQRSVWDFPRPPVIENVKKLIWVAHHGKTIAESRNALAVLETASPPTYYLPNTDVDKNALVELIGKSSMCEWKGHAIYWALKTMGDQPVAWSYPNAFPEYDELKNHIAFYPQFLDCYIDDEKVKSQASTFYAGWITSDITGPFKGDKGTEHW